MLAICTAWYVRDCLAAGRWLGGGSTVGLVTGTIAGLVIAFEMLLWPRKALRRLRLFPTKYWLAAHLWIGLVAWPIAVLHSGFHLGGYLPMSLMVLYTIATVSGIYGWIAQNVLPGWMLRNLPGETIYNQIDHVSQLSAGDVERLLLTGCGPRLTVAEEAESVLESLPADLSDRTIVIGAVRQRGRTSGWVPRTHQVGDARDDRATLWAGYDQIAEFLQQGSRVKSPVSERRQSELFFSQLRQRCGESSQGIIEAMQEAVEQRRQFDTQGSAHRWLHGWLPLHIGVSVAVSVLLIVHVWTALKYW